MTSADFSNNSFTGTIPNTIGGLTSITNLDFSYNYLTGSVPNVFKGLTVMGSLQLQNNYLTMGAFSEEPELYFSNATRDGLLNLELNCLTFSSKFYPSQNTIGTHCKRTYAHL